ncbi:hypothetical protein GCM10010275_34720 [Streptomyces litmocidini]|nr:hypothetical protein GCM10010275_34720 [Streptomyces litmocidini]
MARWNPWRRRSAPRDTLFMPEYMEGVSPENWNVLVQHEYMRQSALERARRNVEAELARPREQNLSNLGVTVVATSVFGIISVAMFAIGFGWWALLPLSLLVPALALGLHFTRRVIRDAAAPAGTPE